MRAVVLLSIVAVSACSSPGMFRRGPTPNDGVEAQYARALTLLGPSASGAAMDTALTLLDAYLAHDGYLTRRADAVALRRLAADAVQLARVSALLQQERAETDARPKASDGTPAPKTDTDSVKEIQRLKDALAAANAELERIRKRLATQKP